MPATAANVIDKTEKANATRYKRRQSKDLERVDSITGFVVGQICDPKNLEVRGRGFLRAAFADLAMRRGLTGPPAALEKIPEGNMRAYEILVMHALSPEQAGASMFGVSRQAIARWLKNGAEDDCRDPMQRAFFLRTDRALAVGRGELEYRVALADPLAALTRGPIGRSTPDMPGWTDERTVKFANHTGDGPPVFTLDITTGGYRTAPAERQLADGAITVEALEDE